MFECSCVKRSLLHAVQTFSSNLSIIHQEISTSSMQGHNNFKVSPQTITGLMEMFALQPQAVIGELDKIIELINSNSVVTDYAS